MKTKQILETFVALFFLMTVTSAAAQSSFKLDPQVATLVDNSLIECIYNYNVNLPLINGRSNEKLVETYTTILQANSSTSKFWDWNSFKKDSIIYSSASLSLDSIKKIKEKYYAKVKYLFVPVVLKNYPQGKMTVTDDIIPDDYIYEENKADRKWVLQDGMLTVCGYVCNKAVASFGGREWTVWYAPEITISDGPWKFYGLPGLILKASDSTGTHVFEAIVIRKSNHSIYLDKNITQLKIGRDKFIKNKNKFEEDPMKNIPMQRVKSISIFKDLDLMMINNKRTSAKMSKKVTYCPLELM